MFRKMRHAEKKVIPNEETIRLLQESKRGVLKTFATKYYPNEAEADEEIELDFQAVQMIEITIEHMTGKEIQEK